jgi:hypothetical protein
LGSVLLAPDPVALSSSALIPRPARHVLRPCVLLVLNQIYGARPITSQDLCVLCSPVRIPLDFSYQEIVKQSYDILEMPNSNSPLEEKRRLIVQQMRKCEDERKALYAQLGIEGPHNANSRKSRKHRRSSRKRNTRRH